MLSDKTVKPVLMYIVIYFIAAVVSIFAVMLCGVDPEMSVSGVVASIGNVGPALGELGSMGNYSAQPAVAKFIYSFDMFLGRVEIYPVLVAVSMILGRDRRLAGLTFFTMVSCPVFVLNRPPVRNHS